ncbi:MAG: histidinol-phosphate aminotransferase family protein [Methanotrichaceae archaeon]|nr:histidinol-phosphate aminotransferase family protein [Methanotrichaceae archaeon]
MLNNIRISFARARECYHGGRFREASQKRKDYPLDFSANINPLGAPPLKDIVIRELDDIGYYPDNRYIEFKQAAAQFVGVGPENIVPGNGSSEIIRLFAEMTLEKGDLALIPQPTFGEYENQSRLFEAKICKVKLHNGLPIVSDHELDNAKAFFLCNPNNPTGYLLSKEDVTELAKRCEQCETFLLVDEAFIELSDHEQSVVLLAVELDYLIIMRSLTKSFGVPGLRLGFGVTNWKLAEIMNKSRIPWSISSLSAAAAPYLLSQTDFLDRSRELIRKESIWLTESLRRLELKPLPTKVNFILVDLEPLGIASDELTENMSRLGVLVRDCQSFDLDKRYIRVAVRNREENLMLIAALKSALKCKG